MEGLRCPKLLWLRKNMPEVAEPPDQATLHLFKVGHRVEEFARQLFPNGTLIEKAVDEPFHQLITKTKQATDENAPFIYEGTFASKKSYCRADVIERTDSGSLNLNEIKMCTELKKEHLFDAGFQSNCIKSAGHEISQVFLIHINPEYERAGELSPHGLFIAEEITSEVNQMSSIIESKMEILLQIARASTAPDSTVGSACKYPSKCPFFTYCHQSVPAYSVFELPYSTKLLPVLLEAGIYKLSDIPSGTPLSIRQLAQVQSAKRNAPVVCRNELREFLKGISYPLFYLDFEAASPCIPPFNCKPYEKLPFQYSLDIIKRPNSAPEHHEYLHANRSDPRRSVVDNLLNVIGEKGTILTWNMAYEKSVLTSLAFRFPEYASSIQNKVLPRIADLIVPFRNGTYADHRFRGSASIKKVLPIMAPKLTYDNMSIHRGDDAAILFENYIDGDISEQQWQQNRQALLEYCGLDTCGMIAIHEALRKACL
jgi:hypothetical protein